MCMCLNSFCPELSVMSILISLGLSSQLPAPGVDQALILKSQSSSHVLSWQSLHARPLPDHLRAVFPSSGSFLMTQDVSLCLATMPGNSQGPARPAAAQSLRARWVLRGGPGLALSLAGRGLCLCLISRPPSTLGTPLWWRCSLFENLLAWSHGCLCFLRGAGREGTRLRLPVGAVFGRDAIPQGFYEPNRFFCLSVVTLSPLSALRRSLQSFQSQGGWARQGSAAGA